ncbi:MFS transporter [Phytoactinopolyspora limicola]|uniref:MFS transporter n=1 Tax=Phytoactinopolyspora limicola TaxID=2715536 RepID=UPI00140E9635|nr:MFS transporter [Phytoactinopolyspora limicola]
MIPRRTVHHLGASQLICWGVTYYLIGVFGGRIADDLNWSSAFVYGGFSVALVVMGLLSPLAGRLIDRHGGRRIMSAGSVLAALGCTLVAVAHHPITYVAAWICLGVSMRCTLYDAAFATVARIGGPTARRAMSQVTLLGGLASTAFWPIGHALANQLGWRGAVFCYAGFALLTLPLHMALPDTRFADHIPADGQNIPAPLAITARERRIAGALYTVMVTSIAFLGASMSAHLFNLLTGLGLAAATAVWVSTLRGISQSTARLADVVFGRRIPPLTLALGAASLLPAGFVAGLWGGQVLLFAVVFTALYGAGNGLLTIARGALPLVLFDHRTYGAFVGRLLVPGFMFSASAPLLYALVIDGFGERGALLFAAALGGVVLTAAALLRARYHHSPPE